MQKSNSFVKFAYRSAEAQTVVDQFEQEFQIVGAVDETHIKIKAPVKNREDYFNRKQYHGVKVPARR